MVNYEWLHENSSGTCEYCNRDVGSGGEMCQSCGAPIKSKNDKIQEAYRRGFGDGAYSYKKTAEYRMARDDDVSPLLAFIIVVLIISVAFFTCYGVYHFVTGIQGG